MSTALDMIIRKRDGGRLSYAELESLVGGYVSGEVPDYQMAAWLMAVFFQGMDDREAADLTGVLLESGDKLDLSDIPGVKVDKHSSGGVGDKTSLVLLPLVAACGLPVAKLSGRGLAHTGGTIDKLESIPGFRAELSVAEIKSQVKEIGLAISGQTEGITPADKKLYALRDVTGTVDSVSLIAASIVSKKLAAGADAIVFDVKTGNGAFMKSLAEAEALAELMLKICKSHGRRAVALITDMDQPLGRAVGNALEVREAVETLSGRGPVDLLELCLSLGAEMLVLGGAAPSRGEARQALERALGTGAALEKLRRMVQAQGGSLQGPPMSAEAPLPPAVAEVRADKDGMVTALSARMIGLAAVAAGAGRRKLGDSIDHRAGLLLHKKVGQRALKGDLLCEVRATSHEALDEALDLARGAYQLSAEQDAQAASRPVVLRRLG